MYSGKKVKLVKCHIKDPKVITQEDDVLLWELDKLIFKFNEVEGPKGKG